MTKFTEMSVISELIGELFHIPIIICRTFSNWASTRV